MKQAEQRIYTYIYTLVGRILYVLLQSSQRKMHREANAKYIENIYTHNTRTHLNTIEPSPLFLSYACAVENEHIKRDADSRQANIERAKRVAYFVQCLVGLKMHCGKATLLHFHIHTHNVHNVR